MSSSNGTIVKSQIYESEDGNYTIVFQSEIPALGFSTYFITPSSRKSCFMAKVRRSSDNSSFFFTSQIKLKRFYIFTLSQVFSPSSTVSLQNSFLTATFDTNNLLSTITLNSTGQTIFVNQSYYWYNSSIGNAQSPQASGANH